jgi:hypothetical protein
MEPEFLLFVLPLKADAENAAKNLQMELINLQCDTNLTQKFPETDLKGFYSFLPKEKFPVRLRCSATLMSVNIFFFLFEQ